MNWSMRSVVTAIFLATTVVPAWADMSFTNPEPKPEPAARIRVPFELGNAERPDSGEIDLQVAARLVIPRAVLEEALQASGPDESLGGNSSLLPGGTVVAGLLLAVAVTLIPFAWHRYRYGKQVITATVVAFLVCSGWTIAKADLGPHRNNRGPKKHPDSFVDPGNPSRPWKGLSPSAEPRLLQIEIADEPGALAQLQIFLP